MLWIAFIFQYLWDTTQLSYYFSVRLLRCELLSFFSIFGIQHNFIIYAPEWYGVVNCFHFSVSLGYNTTQFPLGEPNPKLWIAFIFQYLWDTTQLKLLTSIYRLCCELLSFFSIFGIQHNTTSDNVRGYFVVNCFHFSVSLGYNTTKWTKNNS